jgi:hypothetical protein
LSVAYAAVAVRSLLPGPARLRTELAAAVTGGPLVDAAERGDPVHLTAWDLRRRDLRVEAPVRLVGRCGVRPWRMTVQDYLAAPGGGPLSGREVATPWEPALAEVMRTRAVAVHEEQVVEELLTAWPGKSPAR